MEPPSMSGNNFTKIVVALLLFSALSFELSASPKVSYAWVELERGLSYAKIDVKWDTRAGFVHAFRIDPKKFKLKVLQASQWNQQKMAAKDFADHTKALITINGNFFSPEGKELGLIVANGKILKPLHSTSWWSVFQVKKGAPSILPPDQFQNKNIDMAIQVGPRLVIDGKIPPLKNAFAARSMIGITHTGQVVLAVTEKIVLTPNETGIIMKSSRWQGGLECRNAMALDGGSSSQLYATTKDFTLDVPGINQVPTAIGVFPH